MTCVKFLGIFAYKYKIHQIFKPFVAHIIRETTTLKLLTIRKRNNFKII